MSEDQTLLRFITESNAIEGICREPLPQEIGAHQGLLEVPWDAITVGALEAFVENVQPGAKLRKWPGMNVKVYHHVAPPGGPQISSRLEALLKDPLLDAYERHLAYQDLHPFTDGNGRSGRALWLHEMGGIAALKEMRRGFLHEFYYQTLRVTSVDWVPITGRCKP